MGQGRFGGQKISSVPVGYDRDGRPLRVRRRRKETPGQVVLYPILDGPGVALLVMWPPLLAVLTLPVVDLFVTFNAKNVLNPIVLLMVPLALPMVGAFGMVIGYILLFVGRTLAATAYGEDDHPRWPRWETTEIAEGLGRWIWGGIMGLLVGGFPAYAFWINCGEVDATDWFIFIDLALVGGAYALMAVAASLLHENLIAANPYTILQSIMRVGWDYVSPCLVGAFGLISSIGAWYAVLFHAPSVVIGLFGIWLCWIWTMYQLMIVFRALGLTYYRNAERLDWFRKPLRWGI